MAYERQTWETGTVIPESKLLHIENGIYDVTETADQNTEDIATNKTSIEKNASDITSLNSALAELPTFDFGTQSVAMGGESTMEATITFSKTFKTTPVLVATLSHASGTSQYIVLARSISTTQATIAVNCANASTATFVVRWIAIA